jgi:predicted aconitase with swiveling domain
MDSSKVKGYYASRKTIDGEALVLQRPLDLLSVEPLTGTLERGHEKAGETVKDKILIAPCLCGATIAEFIPLFLGLTGNKPKAIVTTASRAYTPIMSGCLASETPLLFGLDRSLAATIRAGDTVHIDAGTGDLTVRRNAVEARMKPTEGR